MERYLGESIPKLGFGLMRLPMVEGKIDVEQVKEMVDLFLDAGFRYFDTAYGYNDGDSERAAKAALVDRYPRERFFLATKLPAWTAKSEEDAKQMFYTSLERTGAGYFDFYLLHNIGKGRLEFFDNFGIWDFLAARKAEGLIRHLGFSAHCTPEMLDEVLNAHPDMEFVQLQINYADWDSEGVQARKCYEVARAYGKPVVIMEPVKGGMLASLPDAAAAPLRKAAPERSLASWALRFAASLDGLVTVLSGMSNVEQMKENLALMRDLPAFTEAEKAALEETRTYLASMPQV
ncbi:MAG: aldo/keto reductase, partial [Bacteroidales bacterium]|nr:aldo/keto reductase [Bacteroidales bacterium]